MLGESTSAKRPDRGSARRAVEAGSGRVERLVGLRRQLGAGRVDLVGIRTRDVGDALAARRRRAEPVGGESRGLVTTGAAEIRRMRRIHTPSRTEDSLHDVLLALLSRFAPAVLVCQSLAGADCGRI